MATVQAENHYKVISRIATGGMAEVFHAESVGLAGFTKPVAIKRVLPHLAGNDKFIRMFLDEARLSARLNHRNIVQVFDVGRAGDAYFIVMEYVDGVTLKAVMDHLRKRGENVSVPIAVHIAVETCNALHYAHRLKDSAGTRLNIVHRDISPANILVSRTGGVKLVDFGLAKAVSQLEKTDPGVLKGKFGYLAPETAQGGEADALADLFAVGIVLWEMLAGRRLFLGETDFDTVQKVRRAEVPSLTEINPEVPAALDALVRKALAVDKAERFASAGAMARALTEFLFKHGQPVDAEDVAILVHEVLDVKYTSRTLDVQPRTKVVDKALEEQLKQLEPVGGPPITIAPPAADDSASVAESIVPPSTADATPSPKSAPARERGGGPTARGPLVVTSTDAVTTDTRPREWAPRKQSRGATIGLVVVALGGGAAAAYFTGLVPGVGARTRGAAATDPAASRDAGAAASAAGDAAASGDPRAAAGGDAGGATGATPPPQDPNEPLPEHPGGRARAQLAQSIETRIRACEAAETERHGRHARVYVTYEGATGRVVEARLNGAYFETRPIGQCILAAVRDVPAPRFSDPRWETDYAFMIH